MIATNTQTSEAPPSGGRQRSVFDSVGGVLSDVTNLAELQWQLFRADLAASQKRIVRSLIFAAVGVLLVVACVPIAMLTLAALLYSVFDLPLVASLGLALLTGLLLTGFVAWVAWKTFTKATRPFHRSSSELKRNIAWVRKLGDRQQSEIKPERNDWR